MMETLTYSSEGGVGIATLNRPEALNAINRAMLEEMGELLGNAADINVLIVTGSGDKAFAAGADVKEMSGLDAEGIAEFSRLGQSVVKKLEEVSFITIAAVNGFALGGGLEIAMGCDLIYASDKAQFGLPEIKLGLIPGWGGTHRLARSIGKRRAKEMMLTGSKFSAERAYEMGLVNKVFAHEGLVDECLELSQKMLSHSPFALRQIKQALNAIDADDEFEEERFAECFATEEAQRDIEKFLNKQKS